MVDDAGGIHFEVDAGHLVEEGVGEWEWDHRLDSIEGADETDMGGGHAERTDGARVSYLLQGFISDGDICCTYSKSFERLVIGG